MFLKAVPTLILGALILSVPAGAQEEPAADEERMNLGLEPLESCINRWDPGSHMTKAEWRESCKRISEERGTYLKEHGVQPEGD